MKYMRFFLILALAIAGLGFYQQPAKAGAFTYTSSINLQNLENTTANITLFFYNQDGTQNISPVADTVGALGSKVYFPIPANTGFNGSVVIDSTTLIASVSNISGNNYAANASYVSSSAGSTKVLIPTLMKMNSGYSTWFNVQNTDTTPGTSATIKITYSDGTSVDDTIAAGAAKTYDQLTDGKTHPKVFSAIVESSNGKPLAATVIEESTKIMFAYNGFINSQTNPVMPLINANNSGYQTGVQIQNAGAVDTEVTVSYLPSLAGTACIETQTILAGKSNTFALNAFAGAPLPGMTTNCIGGAKFIGSAKVTTNTGAVKLVTQVNQFKGTLNGGAYDGFDADTATGKVVFPLIMNANGADKFWTSINLMNVGAGSTTVTCTFTAYGAVQPGNLTETLAAGAGISWLQNSQLGSTKYIGSATCEAPGGKIVGVVNELGGSLVADQVLVYEGINVAPTP